jgi:hypothetical protein
VLTGLLTLTQSFFEKLAVAQLVKKFPTFLWIPMVHYHDHMTGLYPEPDESNTDLHTLFF